MIARAPGKLVLSGAYSVLEGAPSLVAAVDRYVTADGERAAEFLTDEVQAAIAAGSLDRAPWFDAAELREKASDGTSRKLGLGSSAAILVASMAARLADGFASEAELRDAIFPAARAAHWVAQRGGSGIDVASSTYGGVIRATLGPPGDGPPALSVAPHPLPEGTVVEVYASPVSSSTRDLLALVRALAARDPVAHRACLDVAKAGARAAAQATTPAALVRAVSDQTTALAALGHAAGAGIVTPDVEQLRLRAEAEGGTFAPSGAGGGDIAFFLGDAPASGGFRADAARHGLLRLQLRVGARGVHRADPR